MHARKKKRSFFSYLIILLIIVVLLSFLGALFKFSNGGKEPIKKVYLYDKVNNQDVVATNSKVLLESDKNYTYEIKSLDFKDKDFSVSIKTNNNNPVNFKDWTTRGLDFSKYFNLEVAKNSFRFSIPKDYTYAKAVYSALSQTEDLDFSEENLEEYFLETIYKNINFEEELFLLNVNVDGCNFNIYFNVSEPIVFIFLENETVIS